MGSAYFEEGVLHKGSEYGQDLAETEASNLSKGSFALRCANYFNDIWHEKIISYNLRVGLVDNIAQRYVNRGIELSELVKEGNLGLTHALENFELEGGSRFSTYAARCIRQNIERAIMSKPGIGRSSDTSKVMPSPVIADPHPRRQSVSRRGAQSHHQDV